MTGANAEIEVFDHLCSPGVMKQRLKDRRVPERVCQHKMRWKLVEEGGQLRWLFLWPRLGGPPLVCIWRWKAHEEGHWYASVGHPLFMLQDGTLQQCLSEVQDRLATFQKVVGHSLGVTSSHGS